VTFFKKSQKTIGGVSLFLVIALCLFAVHLARSAAARYAEGASDPGRGSTERLRDISKLSRIPGPGTTQFLIDIAINPSVPFDSRNAAVTALKGKQDPSISADLAALLQPHNAETLRSAVADALTQLPCSVECARSVLHYLERMWRGDSNSEDLVADSPPVEDLTKLDPQLINSQTTAIRKQRQQVVAQLESVLSENPAETLKVLRDIYGLGSFHPSYFAIYMVGELRLSQACGDLNTPHLSEINGEQMATQIEAVKQHLCTSR
jgi:hypothetical protein